MKRMVTAMSTKMPKVSKTSTKKPGPLANAVKGGFKQIGSQIKEAVGNVKMNIANRKNEKMDYTPIRKSGVPKKPSNKPMTRKGH